MANGSPISPRLVRAGIVTMDPNTSAVQSIIALQYNPDTLTRTLQIQAVKGGEDGVRVDALRLRGPAVETIKLEAEMDASDQLELPSQNPLTVQYGLQPQLAQLEMLVNPTVETLEADKHAAVCARDVEQDADAERRDKGDEGTGGDRDKARSMETADPGEATRA